MKACRKRLRHAALQCDSNTYSYTRRCTLFKTIIRRPCSVTRPISIPICCKSASPSSSRVDAHRASLGQALLLVSLWLPGARLLVSTFRIGLRVNPIDHPKYRHWLELSSPCCHLPLTVELVGDLLKPPSFPPLAQTPPASPATEPAPRATRLSDPAARFPAPSHATSPVKRVCRSSWC